MSMKDRVSYMKPLVVAAADIVDRRGYNSLTFLISATGAGAGTIALTHGDVYDGSDQVAVAAADIVGAGATLAMGGTGAADMRMVGYVGAKRYVKCNPGVNATMVALLMDPSSGPTPNPPAKFTAPVAGGLEAATEEAPADPPADPPAA